MISPTKQERKKDESELWSAISAFERILEVMPTDRLALETLSDAYEQLGDKTRAAQYLVRLSDILVHDRDVKASPDLINRLREIGDTPDLNKARAKLQDMMANELKTPNSTERKAVAFRRNNDITREVSLAWTLMEAGELTQEEYAAVVQDLSENSGKRVDVPISVLHALHDRQFKKLDRVMVYMSRLSNVPVVALSSFDIQKDAYTQLPTEFVTRIGAIAFESVGADLLVAVLNPMDTELQAEVRRITGRKCHFYLTGASDYDTAVVNIRKALAEKQTAAV